MKKNKKRNPTTIEQIAKRFKVKPNYVRCILKVGRVKPLNFDRMKRDRMALYVAYSDAVAEERGSIPEVPGVQPVMYYHSSTNTVSESMYQEVLEAENSATVSTTFVSDDEPVVTSTQVIEASLTVDSPQVASNKQLVEHIDMDQVKFRCPCGCNKEFIINHKKLTYEQE